MWTRWITVPLAGLQTFAMINLLQSQQVLGTLSSFDVAVILVVATAGTVFLMWLGELITEKGIGNGVSLIIFAGIVASLPSATSRFVTTFDSTDFFSYALFLAIAVLTIAGVVMVNEGQRNIPVSYAKRIRGSKMYGGTSTHLPLRVNQAGVIPIIFAISIMLFPGVIASFFANSANLTVANIAQAVSSLFQNQLFYGSAYFIMVVLFTYFYTAVIFDPYKISENLQKQGGYIPGIRPGNSTAEYLAKILNSGLALLAQMQADNLSVDIDKFVFADIPGLDFQQEVPANEPMPDAANIVHEGTVANRQYTADNAVLYSSQLGAEVGDFNFNWIGLYDTANSTLIAAAYVPLQKKWKNSI